MRISISILVALLCQSTLLQAQLYAPEIKVENIANGKVGIGTNDPNTKLHLYDSSTWQFRLQNPGAGGSNWYIGASSDGWSSGGNKLIFSSNGTSTNAALAIDQSTGNLGIGTHNTGYKISVDDGNGVDGNTEIGFQSGRAIFGYNGISKRAYMRAGSGKDIIFETNGANVRMMINDNGRVAIGPPPYNFTFLLNVNGSAAKPGGGSWSTYSDSKLKKNVLAFTNGLELINKIRPVRYHYNGKLNLPSNQQYIGIIAEELQQIAPFMVNTVQSEEGENYLTVDPSAFTFILINAVKEQQALIEEQQALIEGMQQSIKKLEQKK